MHDNPVTKKHVFYCIDWLTVSFDWLTNYRLYMPEDCFSPSDSKISPLPAYNRAVRLNVGRMDWHSEKPAQKRLLTFSGSELNNMRSFGVSERQLLTAVLSLPKASITRLDFAADIHHGEMTAGDVKTLLERGYIKTFAKHSSDIEERIIGSEGAGMTVYIGSRSSTMMLRVYDKGKKEKAGYNWLRLEIEVKKDRAMMLARAMLKDYPFTAGCAAIRQYAAIDSPEISDALTGGLPVDLSVGRKETDWEKWVLTVALPAVTKAFEQELPGVVQWVSEIAWKKLSADVLSVEVGENASDI